MPNQDSVPTCREQLEALLSGRVRWENSPEAIRSWAGFYIWQAGLEIVAMDGVEKRRAALDKIPETVRPHVKREVKRLWAERKADA